MRPMRAIANGFGLARLPGLARLRGSFARSVGTLLAGNVLGQLITMLAMPVLARLYSPADFGTFAVYAACTGIIASVGTGQYQQAIVVPRGNGAALALLMLALAIAAVVSCCLIVAEPLFIPLLIDLLPESNLATVGWLLPASVFFLCSYDALYYFANRHQRYQALSGSKIAQGTGFVGVALIASIDSHGSGLVFGMLFGQALAAVWLLVALRAQLAPSRVWRPRRWHAVARRYRHFPKHLVLAEASQSIYGQLPLLFLTRVFDNGIAGQYSLALRMVGGPANLLAQAVGDVYRQRAAGDYLSAGRFDRTMRRALLWLAAGGFLPFALLAVGAPWIFTLLFGEGWNLAGQIGRVMAFVAFIAFCSVPLDKGVFIRQATRYRLVWTWSRMVAHLIACLVGWWAGWGPLVFITIVATIDIAFYLIDLAVNYRLSKGDPMAQAH